jgi:hypothetical protein
LNIKNIQGPGDKGCKCDTWLDHWDQFSGQSPIYCPVAECMNHVEIGARVQKDSPTDKGWYIVPLCRKHYAMQGETLRVNDSLMLVSAKVSETCA